MEREEWLTDPRFDTAEHREQNRGELVALLDELFLQRSSQEWLERLWKEDQIVSPVWDYSEIVAHPHVEANKMVVTVTHRRTGEAVRTVGIPVKLSRTPGEVRASYPELGEHTEEVLQELGYTWDDILSFKEEGVIP